MRRICEPSRGKTSAMLLEGPTSTALKRGRRQMENNQEEKRARARARAGERKRERGDAGREHLPVCKIY